MEIILVRHGKPESANNPRVTAAGYLNWVRQYNASNVSNTSPAPTVLSSRLAQHYVLSSDLKRAKQSTYLALNREPAETLALFQEMDIPHYKLPLKFKAWTWFDTRLTSKCKIQQVEKHSFFKAKCYRSSHSKSKRFNVENGCFSPCP